MAKFTEDQACPKCGYGDHTVALHQFTRGLKVTWDAALNTLQVRCLRCDFMWMCRPLDYKEDIVAPVVKETEDESNRALDICAECGESMRGGGRIQTPDGKWVHYATFCYRRYQEKLGASQSSKPQV